MKIAVTYENGEVFQHFGHTQQFNCQWGRGTGRLQAEGPHASPFGELAKAPSGDGHDSRPAPVRISGQAASLATCELPVISYLSGCSADD